MWNMFFKILKNRVPDFLWRHILYIIYIKWYIRTNLQKVFCPYKQFDIEDCKKIARKKVAENITSGLNEISSIRTNYFLEEYGQCFQKIICPYRRNFI